MSADLLRRAAATLREHAGQARTSGEDWVAETRDGVGWINTGPDSVWGSPSYYGEAEYAALMHPPVALALADWLEFAAGIRGDDSGRLTDLPDYPLVLARAILREAP